jgi:hypothetical protein
MAIWNPIFFSDEIKKTGQNKRVSGCDVHLLHMQMNCFEANHIAYWWKLLSFAFRYILTKTFSDKGQVPTLQICILSFGPV